MEDLCLYKNYSGVKLSLENGENSNLAECLRIACRGRTNLNLIKLLVDHGADPSMKERSYTALSVFLRHGHSDHPEGKRIIDYLRKQGCELISGDCTLACEGNLAMETKIYVLKMGASLGIGINSYRNHMTPFHAFLFNHPTLEDLKRATEECRPNFDILFLGQTVIDIVCDGPPDILEYVVERCSEETRMRFSMTSWFPDKIVTFLNNLSYSRPHTLDLMRCVNVNAKNIYGNTIFYLVCDRVSSEAMEFLIELGADLDDVDCFGISAVCKMLKARRIPPI